MSTQHHSFSEVTVHPEHSAGTGRIWRVFWVLSILTVIELALGYFLYAKHGTLRGPTVLLSKIVIMTIVVPLCLFIWFIIAFLWDGDSWKNLRNTNGGSREHKTEQVQEHTGPAADPHQKP